MKSINLHEYIWPEINRTDHPITLWTYNTDPKLRRPFVINPGERIIFPKQVQFLKALHKFDAVLYGGAIYSGKSYILRWAAIYLLIEWAKPVSEGGLGLTGVSIGLFCETYKDLADRHITCKGGFKQFPPEIGKWYNDASEFRLNPERGGGIVKLRNLDEPSKYASVEFAALLIDELTHTSLTTFDFLRSRLRDTRIPHTPIACATNPGSTGHLWVLDRFVNPDTRVKPVYNETLDYWTKGYEFIQAFPTDNPFLSKQYAADMATWPEKQRRALMEGDWTVYQGQFLQLDPNIHWIQDFEIPDSWTRIRVVDQGLAHPTVCLWMAMDPKTGVGYVYREYSRTGEYVDFHKKQIVSRSIKNDGTPERYTLTVGDPAMFKETSIAGQKTVGEVYNDPADGFGSLNMTKATNDRIIGWQALANAFGYSLKDGADRYKLDDSGRPEIAFARAPKLYVFRSCPMTWKSLTNIVHDDLRVEDVKKTTGVYEPGMGDDEADCVRYGWLALSPSSGMMGDAHSPHLSLQKSGGLIPAYQHRKRMDSPYARF